jgi:hypothetical protein
MPVRRHHPYASAEHSAYQVMPQNKEIKLNIKRMNSDYAKYSDYDSVQPYRKFYQTFDPPDFGPDNSDNRMKHCYSHKNLYKRYQLAVQKLIDSVDTMDKYRFACMALEVWK